MRPPELDVTFVLQLLDCHATEDTSEDEPYLWALGFKVDADTIGPPPAGSLVPTLGVKIIEGTPFFTHVVGAGSMKGGQTAPIHPLLGTRAMRLRPALLDVVGWFPGLAGMICMLWDEDGFAPSTAEAGFKKLKAVLGPAIANELNALVRDGAYDNELAKDANGVTLPDPPEGRSLQWRMGRLADPGGRTNAVKAMVSAVKDAVKGPIEDAITDAAGLDELIDPDDLLGVEAQVNLGSELSGTQPFSMSFTDDDANYTARGIVTASPATRAVLDTTLTAVSRRFGHITGIWRRVCWGPVKLYWVMAYDLATTTRFELRPTLGPPPQSVRWFIDDRPLPDGASTLSVQFEPADKHYSGPEKALAGFYPGGPGTLNCSVAGNVLDVSFAGGTGAYFGQVRALYAYPGDPTLFPPGAPTVPELIQRGYDRTADLEVVGVELEMDAEYREDVRQCMLKVREFDRKYIPVNWGKSKPDPGDPPNWRESLALAHDLTRAVDAVAGMDMEIDVRQSDLRPRRRFVFPR